jgi:hypothetical protein
MKVETHNHPTAISPFPGAATGSGGEIRDEGATGRGAKPKAGLCGFSVSHLRIPDFIQPWERDYGKPDRIVRRWTSCWKVRSARRRSITNSAVPIWPAISALRAGWSRRAAARLSQADHDRRRTGQHPRTACPQGRIPAGNRHRGAGRTGDADRTGWRRGVQHGGGQFA